MASKVHAVEETNDAIIVFITHGNADSFSRSVNRVANKAWRDHVKSNILRSRLTNFCSARYAHTDIGDGTMSTVVYTRSHERANEILNQLHPGAI